MVSRIIVVLLVPRRSWCVVAGGRGRKQQGDEGRGACNNKQAVRSTSNSKAASRSWFDMCALTMVYRPRTAGGAVLVPGAVRQ